MRRFLRFEVFKAVTMKKALFCDIKTQFVTYRSTLRLRYRAQPVNAMWDLRFSQR
jgi:hypothetical protein